MTTRDPLAEYKEGLRDGYAASVKVAQVVAADNGTAGDVVELLEVLATSHVLDTRDGGGRIRKLWPPAADLPNEPPANT